jgi:hypothetical protein
MDKVFSTAESKAIAQKIGVKLSKRGVEQLRKGLRVELEHGTEGPKNEGVNTNVTNDEPIKTGKIALAHLTEAPGYYTALDKMEKKEDQKGEKKVIIKKHLNK